MSDLPRETGTEEPDLPHIAELADDGRHCEVCGREIGAFVHSDPSLLPQDRATAATATDELTREIGS